jgi:hypothetical protein
MAECQSWSIAMIAPHFPSTYTSKEIMEAEQREQEREEADRVHATTSPSPPVGADVRAALAELVALDARRTVASSGFPTSTVAPSQVEWYCAWAAARAVLSQSSERQVKPTEQQTNKGADE